jgi:F-type H+-transporting ATPase subunit delta
LAKRYAKALFELAAEQQLLEKARGEVHAVAALVEKNKRLRAYLFSPEIEKSQKLKVVETIFKKKVSPLFYHFLLLLVDKGRQVFLPEIVFEMDRLYDRAHRRKRVVVRTAVPLDDEEYKDIESTLAKSFDSELVIEYKTDPDILAGMIVQVEGKVIDWSLRQQLTMLKRKLKS